MPGPTIGETRQANFPGACCECGARFPAGQIIQRAANGWIGHCHIPTGLGGSMKSTPTPPTRSAPTVAPRKTRTYEDLFPDD
jgi:hypothetical protein